MFSTYCMLQFYNLLETNQAANGTLMYRGVTVFAPTNYAFQKYKATNQDPNLVLYHMCKYWNNILIISIIKNPKNVKDWQ